MVARPEDKVESIRKLAIRKDGSYGRNNAQGMAKSTVGIVWGAWGAINQAEEWFLNLES